MRKWLFKWKLMRLFIGLDKPCDVREHLREMEYSPFYRRYIVK